MRRMLFFLNDNSGAIQAVTVVILLLVTWWYAYTTKQMATVMQNQFLQQTKPFLSIATGVNKQVLETDLKSIRLIFELKNVGQVPLTYENSELEIQGVSINPSTSTLLLFPGQASSIYSNMQSIQGINDWGQGAQGKIKIIFWATGNPNVKYFIVRHFTLASKTDTFVDKEDYGEIKEK